MIAPLFSTLNNPMMDTPELTFLAAPTEVILIDLLKRWQSWPKADGLPGREQFEPADMPHLLPHIALVEYDRHSNVYRDYNAFFRYIGTRLGDDFQMSQHTRRHMSDFGAQIAQRWFPVYDRLRSTRAPFAVQGVPYLLDKSYLRFEVLYLPLARGDATDPAQQQTAPAEVDFALFAAHFTPNLEG
jgi:hypothetical protein